MIRDSGVRDAREVALLAYMSAPASVTAWTGDELTSLALLERAARRTGTAVSPDVVRVVELDGRVVAAAAAYRAGDVDARCHAVLRCGLAAAPPWRWPALWRAWRGAGPLLPVDGWLLDVLAVLPGHRGRGLGRALLADVVSRARRDGATRLSCLVEETNHTARGLYARVGMTPTGQALGGTLVLSTTDQGL